jgi:hypothetical protein
MIKSISIKNIRGIGSQLFEVDLMPNKPSILIAPNGFGKSSFARAFASMNRDRIKLEEMDFHKNSSASIPEIILVWNDGGAVYNLAADNTKNEISSYFDCHVISSNMRAKGVKRTFGGQTQVSASIVADSIILYDDVPERIVMSYSYVSAKRQCAWLSTAVINLSAYLSNNLFCDRFIKNDIIDVLKKTAQVRQINAIADFRARIEPTIKTFSRANALSYIESNELDSLLSIKYIAILANFFQEFEDDVENYKISHAFVCAIQLSEIFRDNEEQLYKFCKRKSYECEKNRLTDLFASYNSSWQSFVPKETGGALVIDFPKLHHISNGQRDSLNFIASLEKAKKRLRKQNSILIIDEVFDYMDEANIVSAQYYITNLIDEYKSSSKNIYPIILTHLSAELFSGYVFSNKKKPQVRYLQDTECLVNEQFKKILKERGDRLSLLKQPIENKLLHYNPIGINLRNEFRSAGLKETWGEDGVFRSYTIAETNKYLDDQNKQPYDSAAVCCELRVKIEELVYGNIDTPDCQTKFINEMIAGTNEKLDYCQSIGIEIPEHFYLLGLIYNEALHWKDNDGFERKIAARLNNLSIRTMIKLVFSIK